MRLPFSLRTCVLLVLALGAGVIAAWAANQHIQSRVRSIEDSARVPLVQRIVAAEHLPKGVRLAEEHLAVREFPAGTVSSDSLVPDRFTELVGQVLQADLRAGDLILPVYAVRPATATFSDQLASGRRAITMPVDAINSLSGLLEPGDLIDLYVSFDYRRRRMTAPLLQGVLVLATGSRIDSADAGLDGGGYSTVTLDTSPEDAVKLVAARQSGTLTAVLRNSDDALPSQKAVRGDLASILGVEQPMPQPASRKRAPVIYGNSPVRTLSGLKPGESVPQKSGLFDLPYLPDLVSAWRSAQNRSDPISPEHAAQEWFVEDWLLGTQAEGEGDEND